MQNAFSQIFKWLEKGRQGKGMELKPAKMSGKKWHALKLKI